MSETSSPQRTTIDDVIARLDDIIRLARSEQSPIGFFPALYRKVTIKVKEGIADGFFDDGARMEKLDVVFANRYLAAFELSREGRQPTQSWALAFQAAHRWWPVALQHLLLGINAHINLDLGVAAARTAPGDALPALQDDFNKINRILASLVDEVQAELAQIWPLLSLLDRVGGNTDEAVINFSMERARDHAWSVAERMARLAEPEQEAEIKRLDVAVAEIGTRVRHPGVLIGTVLRLVRIGERGSVASKIDILS
ncbi:MAG: hypothetical protein JSW43_03895 [Gemmatimonadota bacterium]|nr:MAG: hypothetical protein JSW43_03895 [Gemmatimonadota bacterium]